MKFRMEIVNQSHKIDVFRNEKGNLTEIYVDDQKFYVSDLEKIKEFSFKKENEIIHFELNKENFDIKLKEIPFSHNENSSKNTNLDQMMDFFKSGLLQSPMPGKIIDIRCQEGDVVEKGKFLLSLEAMKMENEIHAPFKLKIKSILVSVTNTVFDKQTILEYEQIIEQE